MMTQPVSLKKHRQLALSYNCLPQLINGTKEFARKNLRAELKRKWNIDAEDEYISFAVLEQDAGNGSDFFAPSTDLSTRVTAIYQENAADFRYYGRKNE